MYVCFFFNRFLPTKRNLNSWKFDKEIKKSLIKLIERRKENSSENEKMEEETKSPKDLLGLMIQASESCSPTENSNITVHDIVEECKSFFFAGKQTTSNLLTWTTILLAMHPLWQVRAREEVLRVCGARDIPTKDDVVKLKTVKFRTKTMFCLSCSPPCLFPEKNRTATFCFFLLYFRFLYSSPPHEWHFRYFVFELRAVLSNDSCRLVL